MKEMSQKMRTHKFRFSDIMPYSWLFKLKGISSRSSRKHLPSSPKHLSSDASSSRKLRDPPPQASSPPKSSFKRRIKRKTVYKPSSRLKPSSSHKSHVSRNHRSNSIDLEPSDSVFSHAASSPSDQGYEFSCHPQSPSKDTVIHIKDDHFVRKLDDVPKMFVSDSEDSPIPVIVNSSPVRVENVKEPPFQKLSLVAKNSKANSSGIRLRVNSTKIARKKMKERTSPVSKYIEIAESFAIVLSSVDPEKDFRESMVEMIAENNIREQKDLEDLLACYLSLNSREYHDVIIKAFQKTWFQLIHLRL